LTAISRDYELFSRDLFSGWQGDFTYRGQRKGVGSPINADRYELDFRNYWNIGNLAPPYFVVGARLQGIGVNYTQLEVNPGNERELLPIDDRVFYGGDANLRGFNRHALDNRQLGYLTAAYGGLELRVISLLPYRLEPFFLFDVARLGDRRFTLDPPIFLSEGLGLRWASPFGTLRGSVAKGRIVNGNAETEVYRQEWVGFLSFGQEF
jgi:outer membrane translocation and assembly module TamA